MPATLAVIRSEVTGLHVDDVDRSVKAIDADGAILQKPPQNPNAAWLFYFGVRSITAAKAAVEKGGGNVMNGPHQVQGGDFVVIAADPQGAAFAVVGPLAASA